MIRLRFSGCLLVAALGFSAPLKEMPPLSSADRILILAPHPDDEVLACGGLIQQTVADHVPLKIVFLTYGDFDKWAFSLYRRSPVFRPKTMRAMGEVRRAEALAAARVLGLPSNALTFLGYPDYETLTLWNSHWGPSPAYESRNTRVTAVPYATAYRPGAPYKGEDVLHDLGAILKNFRPTKIIVSDPADGNNDHRALYLFTRVALWDEESLPAPDIYSYLIHTSAWPSPRGLHRALALVPPRTFDGAWESLPLTSAQTEIKYAALEKHRTQCVYSNRFMTSFVRSNELFRTDILERRAAKDFDDWQITVDSAELVITGHLSAARRISTACQTAAYGYRRAIPFGNMPKILVKFKNSRFSVYDQGRLITASGVRLTRDRRRFVLRIPLAVLHQPEKIVVSCAVSQKPLSWKSLQILARPMIDG